MNCAEKLLEPTIYVLFSAKDWFNLGGRDMTVRV